MTSTISELIRHFADGFSFSDDLCLLEKSKLMEGRAPSPLVKLTWICDGRNLSIHIPVQDGAPTLFITKLPDSSGFICFESDRKSDNCTLLDAYGKERMRLNVPRELAGRDIPQGAEMWFRNISGPYKNPKDGQMGKFGVTAWIEYAGDYYFELDYRTGKFLWGKEIRF